MAAIGQGFGRQALSLWDQMSASQKAMVLLAIALGVVAMALLLSRAGKVDMVPLYTNLQASDAADIVAKLRELGVAYEVADGGQTVMVPVADVYEARMDLASEGLPKDGTVGFEIFDKTSFGATEFTQKMNYRRALQGELTRTILQLREVEEARVHLAIPEPELYTEEDKPPTASVMLKLKPGAVLGRGQVQGIVRLVASSVEGLSPANVTVVDVDGNILYDATGGSSEASSAASLTLSQLEAKRAYEKELEKSVEGMLAEVLGSRKVVVRVNADIDFDSTEQNSELFQPLDSGLGVIREQARIRETSSASTSPAVAAAASSTQAAGGAGGAGGAGATDTTDATGVAGPADAAGLAMPVSTGVYRTGTAPGQTSVEERTEETTKYEISRVVERRVKPPGAVKRISVAVLVAAPLTDAQQQAITRSVGAAVGVDPAKGDSLVVEAMEFGAPLDEMAEAATTAEAGMATAPPSFGEIIVANIEYVLAGIIGLFLVGLVISVVRGRTVARVAPGPSRPIAPAPQAAAGVEGAVAATAETAQAAAAAENEKAPARQAPKPQTAARVIAGWLDEDKR